MDAFFTELAALGTAPNRFEDFLGSPDRGTKLMGALQALDPTPRGLRNEEIYAAAQGLSRLAESLLGHLLERYTNQERIKNLVPSRKLLLLLRAGPVLDRKSINRVIGTFYDDWPYAAHWRRDIYRVPAGGLTLFGLIYCGLQKLRDMLDEQTGLI